MSINILGLNAYHGDSSAAVLVDGRLAGALEEERLNRIKHWAGLPVLAANRVLALSPASEVQHVAVSRDPRAHLGRKLLRVLSRPQQFGNMASRAANSIQIKRLKENLVAAGVRSVGKASLHFVEHHRAHMASAFFCSPFEEAAVVSIDGFGDFSSVMWGIGRGNDMEVLGAVHFPHSLGLFYTAFTQFLGFPKYGDEYKMMGLVRLWRARICRQMFARWSRTEGDQVRLNLDYFRHHSEGVEMTWEGGEPYLGNVYSSAFVELFGEPRVARSEITPRHMDLAASAQAVLEENYFALLNFVQKKTGQRAVCLAGGVALNCVANGMIFDKTHFKDVYVQPAAHDAGTSIGAALYVWNQVLRKPRSFVMRDVYYGPEYARCGDSARAGGNGNPLPPLERSGTDRPDCPGDCRRQDRRLVPGPHGVWAKGAGKPQYPRRSPPHAT